MFGRFGYVLISWIILSSPSSSLYFNRYRNICIKMNMKSDRTPIIDIHLHPNRSFGILKFLVECKLYFVVSFAAPVGHSLDIWVDGCLGVVMLSYGSIILLMCAEVPMLSHGNINHGG